MIEKPESACSTSNGVSFAVTHHVALSEVFSMKYTLGVLCALTLMMSVGNSATAQRGDSFKRFDRNGDGKLTRQEFPQRIGRLFKQIDADNDGAVTRAEFQAFRKSRGKQNNRRAPRIPDTIRATLDLPYAATDNPRQRLDLLLPKTRKSTKPLPVIAFIHGGGWRNGNKTSGRSRVMRFAASGEYAGVSIGYRLTGEAIWPAQIHDCKAAIRWIRANAKKYNLDPNRIAVMGSSAGGHLVAMLGTSGDVKQLEGTLGQHKGVSSRVTCVVDLYGPSDFLTIGRYPSRLKHDSPNSPEAKLLGGAIADKKPAAREASPTTWVSADDPPFLIIHGTKDPVVPVDQSERLAEVLRKQHVQTLFIHVSEGAHGRFRSTELDRRIGLFFDRHLRGRKVDIPETPVRNDEAAAK